MELCLHIYHNRPTAGVSDSAFMMNTFGVVKYNMYCTVLNKCFCTHLQRFEDYHE